MERVSKKVSFGARNSTPFVFCGARYSQEKDMRVTVDLEDYIKEIEEIVIDKQRARQEDQKLLKMAKEWNKIMEMEKEK